LVVHSSEGDKKNKPRVRGSLPSYWLDYRNMSRLSVNLFIKSIPLLIGIAFVVTPYIANGAVTTVYSEDFEDFSLGDIDGQDGYSYSGSQITIVDDVCQGGGKCVKVDNSSSGTHEDCM